MADSLVHPELKRGHSIWLGASHNVLIRFRSKHIALERLHYHLSADLGLLQANLTYMRNKEGSDYHWIPEPYQRMKLPLFGGVVEALKRFEKRDMKMKEIKEKRHRKSRIQLKVKRTQEQEERKLWSKQHGGDTYGESEDEASKKLQCKCGSKAHSKTGFVVHRSLSRL